MKKLVLILGVFLLSAQVNAGCLVCKNDSSQKIRKTSIIKKDVKIDRKTDEKKNLVDCVVCKEQSSKNKSERVLAKTK